MLTTTTRYGKRIIPSRDILLDTCCPLEMISPEIQYDPEFDENISTIDCESILGNAKHYSNPSLSSLLSPVKITCSGYDQSKETKEKVTIFEFMDYIEKVSLYRLLIASSQTLKKL